MLKLDVTDPSALTFTPRNGGNAVYCTLDSQQQRDLLVLSCKAFAALNGEASFERMCRVWEGDGYGDYYGQIYGNVMLLFECLLDDSDTLSTRIGVTCRGTESRRKSGELGGTCA